MRLRIKTLANRPAGVLLALLLVGCTQSVATPQGDGQAQPPQAEGTVSILAWNVESGGNDPEVIAEQLAELSGYDIYCLSEVSPSQLGRYVLPETMVVSSETGRSDRLQIIFDWNRFELLQQKELHEYRGHELNNGTHRSPLAALRSSEGQRHRHGVHRDDESSGPNKR